VNLHLTVTAETLMVVASVSKGAMVATLMGAQIVETLTVQNGLATSLSRENIGMD
jgi:hypothetical protein